jgi:WhiB family redox-sensing transcriptional regulator
MYLDLIDQLAPDWHSRAACHPETGQNPESWFPTAAHGNSNADRRRIMQDSVNAAIAVCQGCPVRTRCLEAAIANRETTGVWGGRNFDAKAAANAA